MSLRKSGKTNREEQSYRLSHFCDGLLTDVRKSVAMKPGQIVGRRVDVRNLFPVVLTAKINLSTVGGNLVWRRLTEGPGRGRAERARPRRSHSSVTVRPSVAHRRVAVPPSSPGHNGASVPSVNSTGLVISGNSLRLISSYTTLSYYATKLQILLTACEEELSALDMFINQKNQYVFDLVSALLRNVWNSSLLAVNVSDGLIDFVT